MSFMASIKLTKEELRVVQAASDLADKQRDTYNQRRDAMRKRIASEGKAPPNKATCAEKEGTSAGYQRHYWKGEKACDECTAGQNARNVKRKKQVS